MTQRLLAIGLTTLDILGRPIDAVPEAGRTKLVEQIALQPAGTAGGTALVAAKLGLPTKLASAVGNDGAGRFVRQELEAAGVDTTLLSIDSSRTTSATILAIRSNGERPNFHALGASSFYTLTPEVEAGARKAKFVHWGGVGGVKLDGGAGAALLERSKRAGATVTCDLIAPGPRAMDELTRLLPHVDYFMPNIEEALRLSGTSTPDDAAAKFLSLGAKVCIFKWGERGSVLISKGVRQTIPAHSTEVVDTTSCGDSYCAGFVAALDRDFQIFDACRFATAAAALVAQGLGTLGRLESFENTLDYMKQAPLRRIA